MRRGVLMLLPVIGMLSACGQRGDLYFPSAEREAVVTVPAPQVPAPPARPDDDPDDTAGQGTPTPPAPDNAGR